MQSNAGVHAPADRQKGDLPGIDPPWRQRRTRSRGACSLPGTGHAVERKSGCHRTDFQGRQPSFYTGQGWTEEWISETSS